MSATHDPHIDDLLTRLEASDAASIVEAIGAIRTRFRDLNPADLRRAAEALCGLFYVDLYDRADLEPALQAAEAALAEAGAPIVPVLVHLMEGSDIKSHIHLARVMATIGKPALPHLRRLAATSDDGYARSFALYAIGKFAEDYVQEAIPEAVGALMHPDKEVRDSAARTVGKIVGVVEAATLTPRRRAEIFEALLRVTGDDQPAVRAKAVRSLGRMASRGYLDVAQRDDLASRLEALVTRGEERDWDHAYIVRREAAEALGILRGD
jgi:HEAT repeat protein